MTSSDDLPPFVAALGALARALHTEAPPPPADVLAEVLTLLVPTVPGSRWASLSHRPLGRERAVTAAATDPVAVSADELQYAAGDGPCLTAIRGEPVAVRGEEIAHRWPAFGAGLAEQTPVRAVLSQPLTASAARASVNFYFAAEEPFAPETPRGAAEAAALCSVALGAALARNRADNLEIALASSREVAAAVGILMARSRCTYEEAFAQLRSVSQTNHRKVRELAEEILFTGTLPDEITRAPGRSKGWTPEH